MLDPALCDRPTSQWLVLKTIVSTWLTTPALMLLPLAAMIGLPWLIPQLPWKRLFWGVASVLLLIYFIATFPLSIAVATKALVKFLPPDLGVNADAIVLLGRGDEFRQSRVKIAAELWRANRAPLIFASGTVDAPHMIRLLKAEGIPNQTLAYEECSRTTEENARFTATVLQPQGVKQILLITDSPHMLRSLLTFRSFGFTVIPYTSPVPPDLAPRTKALKVFSEYLALVGYGLQGRFLPQSLPEATNLQKSL